MVRALPLALLLVAAGCDTDRYKRPIEFAPHGAAVRANMAAMIIDPTPSVEDPGPKDGAHAALTVERYRADEIEPLGNVSTAPTVVVAPAQ